jgi:hypothetical protein
MFLVFIPTLFLVRLDEARSPQYLFVASFLIAMLAVFGNLTEKLVTDETFD